MDPATYIIWELYLAEKVCLEIACCHGRDRVNNSLQWLWTAGVYLRNSETTVLLYFLRHSLPHWPQHYSHKVSPTISAGRLLLAQDSQAVRLVHAVLLLIINSLRHYGPQAVRSPASSPTSRLFLQARPLLSFFQASLFLSETAASFWEPISLAPALLFSTLSLIFPV